MGSSSKQTKLTPASRIIRLTCSQNEPGRILIPGPVYESLRSLLLPKPNAKIATNVRLRCLAVLGEGGFEPPWENTGRFTACCFRPLSHSPRGQITLLYFHTSSFFFVLVTPRLCLLALTERRLCDFILLFGIGVFRFLASQSFLNQYLDRMCSVTIFFIRLVVEALECVRWPWAGKPSR